MKSTSAKIAARDREMSELRDFYLALPPKVRVVFCKMAKTIVTEHGRAGRQKFTITISLGTDEMIGATFRPVDVLKAVESWDKGEPYVPSPRKK